MSAQPAMSDQLSYPGRAPMLAPNGTAADTLVWVQRRYLDLLATHEATTASLADALAALDARLRERAELVDALTGAQRVLRAAVASHDASRRIVKQFVDAERGGDYLVADAAWVTEARAILANTPGACRCGNCADSEPIALPTRKNIACRSELSECQNHLWTVDHGCPWHRAERA